MLLEKKNEQESSIHVDIHGVPVRGTSGCITGNRPGGTLMSIELLPHTQAAFKAICNFISTVIRTQRLEPDQIHALKINLIAWLTENLE